jgi:hypothetical protein
VLPFLDKFQNWVLFILHLQHQPLQSIEARIFTPHGQSVHLNGERQRIFTSLVEAGMVNRNVTLTPVNMDVIRFVGYLPQCTDGDCGVFVCFVAYLIRKSFFITENGHLAVLANDRVHLRRFVKSIISLD